MCFLEFENATEEKIGCFSYICDGYIVSSEYLPKDVLYPNCVNISCVVSAGFRITSSATYLNSFDIVYDGSAMFLWAEGEMTLMFFVVCLPSMPKATSGVKSMDMCWISRPWASSSADTKGTGKSNS